jgi:hypothetical protein
MRSCDSRHTVCPDRVIKLRTKEIWGAARRSCVMSCRACRSVDQREFPAELNIHLPGPENFETPTVWAFPTLLVCLNCGFTEFFISNAEVRQLKKPKSAEEQSSGT